MINTICTRYNELWVKQKYTRRSIYS